MEENGYKMFQGFKGIHKIGEVKKPLKEKWGVFGFEDYLGFWLGKSKKFGVVFDHFFGKTFLNKYNGEIGEKLKQVETSSCQTFHLLNKCKNGVFSKNGV